MAQDYGDMSFFPSCRLRLRVRLDEFATGALKDKAPKKSVLKIKGVKDERTPLKAIRDPDSAVPRFLLVPSDSAAASAKTPGAPTAQTGSSDGLTHEIEGIIPRSVKWLQNSIRTPDTMTASIRWSDFPIDPRVVRACAVQLFLGTVTEQEYAQGVRGQTRSSLSGAPLNVVPDTYLDEQNRLRTNLRFEGWVDKWKMTWGSDEPLVELECTDNTRLFVKQVRPPRAGVGLEKPLDEAVAEFLTHFPQLEGLTVEYRPASARSATVPPRLKASLSGTSHVPSGVMTPTLGGSGTGDVPSIWDYLAEVCGSVAHTIRVDITTVIIQRVSNLMNTGPVARETDPYQGRDLPSGRYEARAFIFGQNIEGITVERDLARKEPKNIEARGWDVHRKKLLVARFPEKSDVVNSGPGDGKADKTWDVRYAPDGIRDVAMLKQFAEEAYNNAGRHELLVRVKTRNLASFGGGNLDPDLLDMKVGDAFEIHTDPKATRSSVINEAAAKTKAEDTARQYLLGLGFPKGFAAAYAKAYNDAGFQRAYKMKEMAVSWDTNDGVSFEVTGVNYVTARLDRPTSAGTERE